MASSGAIEKAAKALATAGGIAHVAFFTLFAFRVVTTSPLSKVANIVFAVLAMLGLAAEFVGYSLIRYGGKTPWRSGTKRLRSRRREPSPKNWKCPSNIASYRRSVTRMLLTY